MTGLHRLVNDEETARGGRIVVRAWCECGHVVTGVAGSAGRAWRRAQADHAGFAAAAGPGAVGVLP